MSDNPPPPPPIFLYLANPKHGGWVSFTAHLIKLFDNSSVAKISKNTETNLRSFGWNTNYQNISIEALEYAANKMNSNLVITALEKSHYFIFPVLDRMLQNPDLKLTLITHDTVEFKDVAINWIQKNQDRINLIAIRENIKKYLNEEKGITKCKFLLHPFYQWDKKNIGDLKTFNKHNISISRVDFDKHTEFLVKANSILAEKDRIIIYGLVNRLYAYIKLNQFLTPEHIPFNKKYPYYVKPLDLNFDELSYILNDANFSIDMSAIQKDGGGTQYTFLESIYMRVPLILNRKWETIDNNVFYDNETCFYAEDEHGLVNIINNTNEEKRIEVALESYKILNLNIKENNNWINELTN